jgi:hypothetical protein
MKILHRIKFAMDVKHTNFPVNGLSTQQERVYQFEKEDTDFSKP